MLFHSLKGVKLNHFHLEYQLVLNNKIYFVPITDLIVVSQVKKYRVLERKRELVNVIYLE